jgi:predicted DNA-binding protein (MmcQ/YjbR family)
MHIQEFYEYCLNLKGAEESFPFDDRTLAFKVGGKIFAITDVEDFEFINLKCDPDRALELREKHAEIVPGWHMNKKHWNSVNPHGDLDDNLIKELILHSYDLILGSLPAKQRKELDN